MLLNKRVNLFISWLNNETKIYNNLNYFKTLIYFMKKKQYSFSYFLIGLRTFNKTPLILNETNIQLLKKVQ
jgi:hypothetical protein